MQSNHYGRFLLMVGLHFIAMYIFMYAMVNAFLMCNESTIQDAQVKDLCGRIIRSQQSEIDEMKAMLDRMAK